MCANTYDIELTDANGCIITESIDVTEPVDLIITVDFITDALCVNSADGAIDVTISGGTPNYTYSWVTNPTSAFTSAVEDISD